MSEKHTPIKVFCFYAEEDEKWLHQLEVHLSSLKKHGLISLWHHQSITPGADRAREIDTHLGASSLILLLLSADFLASDYYYGKEMKRALARHEAAEALVIPIIARPVDYRNTPFNKLQCLPRNGRAVSSWENQEAAFVEIAREIRSTAERLSAPPSGTPRTETLLKRAQPISRMGRLRYLRLLPLLTFILLLSIILLPLIISIWHPPGREMASRSAGIGGYYPSNVKDSKEFIGLSDGTVAFDTQRDGGDLVSQGAAALQEGRITDAENSWHRAIGQDPSDAEALIYLEDQAVLASGYPYITLVVGTILNGSGADIGVGRDNLQGAYIAQKEANLQLYLGQRTKVRLLIANAGSSPHNADPIAQQIVNAAQTDRTIVGLMGWPYSSRSLAVYQTLMQAKLPMVSPTASTDELTSVSKYFFRVCATDTQQGSLGADYAFTTLKSRRVLLFVGNDERYLDNPYTKTLAAAFSNQFKADGGAIVYTIKYAVSNPEPDPTLPKNLLDALGQYQPDLIYFAGYSSDVSLILPSLPTSGPFANIQVMGGDGLYELGGYSNANTLNRRLHFTAFAYPDEWIHQKLSNPPFFSDYIKSFSGSMSHQGYGYTLADGDVILSFDATRTLLSASQNQITQITNSNQIISRGTAPFTGEELQSALSQIDQTNSIQGVSGVIAFGPDGNSIDKAVVVLSIGDQGQVKYEQMRGELLK